MTERARRPVSTEHDAGGGHEDGTSELQPQVAHDPRVDVSEHGQGSAAVLVDDIRKRFVVSSWIPGRRPKATVDALRGASLTVAHGTIHGVMGPNGSGKTTLLRVLATLVIADAGHASVGGYDVDRDAQSVRRMIGLSTGEERSLYWRLTARQNLEFAAALHGIGRPEQAIARALAIVRLDHEADRPVSGFSQGMSRRLSLARAILHEPDVLLLDEPTRSLDRAARAEFQHVLQALRTEREVTTLLTTHDLGEAASVCNRVSVLREGQFVAHLADVDESSLDAVLRQLAS
jgi:ABC-2 type transport system ATP-binding protein